MKNNSQELIERYLSQDLSTDELIQFEQQLSVDANLASEVGFQKAVINGIKEYRKVQLKTHLNSITVGGGGITASVGAKVAAITIGAGVWVAGYFIIDQFNDIQDETLPPVVISAPKESTGDSFTIVDESQTETLAESDKPVVEAPKKVTKEIVTTTETVKAPTKEIDQYTAITVPLPELAEDTDMDQLPVVPEISESSLINSKQNVSMTVPDIEVENDGNMTLRYRYTDGQLSLFGDFSKSTYEILELNSSKGKSVYVYYESDYYEMKPITEVAELKKVINSNLISELKLIRENK